MRTEHPDDCQQKECDRGETDQEGIKFLYQTMKLSDGLFCLQVRDRGLSTRFFMDTITTPIFWIWGNTIRQTHVQRGFRIRLSSLTAAPTSLNAAQTKKRAVMYSVETQR